MAVFKKGNSWVAQVYVGRRPDGGKEYLSESFRTKKEASDRETELKADILAGRRKPTANHTLGELLDRWLEVSDHLSPTTLYSYKRLVEARIKPALGPVPLKRLTAEKLDEYYLSLRKERKPDGTPLSTLTIRNVHALLRAALGMGVRWKWIAENPALHARPGRLAAHRVAAMPLDRAERLLEAAKAKDEDLAALLRLLAVTGARRGEVCALQWGDVDLDDGSVTIRRAAVEAGGHITIKGTKTNQTRLVALDDATVAELRSLRERTSARLQVLGGTVGASTYLYSSDPEGRTPIRPSLLDRRLRAVAKQAGVPASKLFLGLRHAVATNLIAAGADPRTVAGRLGHDPSLTMKTYAEVLRSADRQAADVIGRAIGQTASK